MVELPSHPWFVAVQFHPEFKSKPLKPHPLFAGFVEATHAHSRGGTGCREAAPAETLGVNGRDSERPRPSAACACTARSETGPTDAAYNVGVQPVHVGPVTFGAGQLVLIAGPCVIESETHALELGHAIAAIARAAGVPYVFKASFDKANRTSLSSFRGPGPGRRAAHPGAREGRSRRAGAHRHPRGRAGRARRRGRRRAADSRVPLPPDRPAGGRGSHRRAS